MRPGISSFGYNVTLHLSSTQLIILFCEFYATRYFLFWVLYNPPFDVFEPMQHIISLYLRSLLFLSLGPGTL